jgi:hypothetical protein
MKRHLESVIFFGAITLFGVGIGIVFSLEPNPAPTGATPAAQILSPTTEISVTTTNTKKPIVRRAMTKPTAPGVGYGGVGAH